jgi:hypothetical protein
VNQFSSHKGLLVEADIEAHPDDDSLVTCELSTHKTMDTPDVHTEYCVEFTWFSKPDGGKLTTWHRYSSFKTLRDMLSEGGCNSWMPPIGGKHLWGFNMSEDSVRNREQLLKVFIAAFSQNAIEGENKKFAWAFFQEQDNTSEELPIESSGQKLTAALGCEWVKKGEIAEADYSKLEAVFGADRIFQCTENSQNIQWASVLNSDESELRPAAVVVVKNACLFVAWRGTASPMDAILDVHATGNTSPWWQKLCGDIKVHSGGHAMLEHDFLSSLHRLALLVKTFKVRKMFFSGHSLGGQVAQIAFLAAQGQIFSKFNMYQSHTGSDEEDELTRQAMHQAFQGVQFEGVFFAAPMAFHFPDGIEGLLPRSQEMVQQLQAECTNYVFGDDIVPRFPGVDVFWRKAMHAIKEKKVSVRPVAFTGPQKSETSDFTKFALEKVMGKAMTEVIDTTLTALESESEKAQQMNGHMQKYRHAATIRYFHIKYNHNVDNIQALPQVTYPVDFTHDQFAALPFNLSKDNSTNLLEYHSALPQCIGDGNISRLVTRRLAVRALWSNFGKKTTVTTATPPAGSA